MRRLEACLETLPPRLKKSQSQDTLVLSIYRAPLAKIVYAVKISLRKVTIEAFEGA